MKKKLKRTNKSRKAEEVRSSTETKIMAKLNIDGSGKYKIDTGIGLLDHMLELFAFHGFFDLDIRAKGDLRVDIHHTNEDIGIVLGKVFKKALGKMIGIKRLGSASVPMEGITATVALDISGRGSCEVGVLPAIFEEPMSQEGYTFGDAKHFFEGFAKHLGMNLNIKSEMGHDLHTTLEPIFKALGKALDQATQIDPRRKGVPSTKGIID